MLQKLVALIWRVDEVVVGGAWVVPPWWWMMKSLPIGLDGRGVLQ